MQMEQEKKIEEKVNRKKWNRNMCDKDRIGKCERLPAGNKVSGGERHCTVYEGRWVGWLDRPKYRSHQMRMAI